MFSTLFSHNLILYNSITRSSLRGREKGEVDPDKDQLSKPIHMYIIKMMNKSSLYPETGSTILGKLRVELLPDIATIKRED